MLPVLDARMTTCAGGSSRRCHRRKSPEPIAADEGQASCYAASEVRGLPSCKSIRLPNLAGIDADPQAALPVRRSGGAALSESPGLAVPPCHKFLHLSSSIFSKRRAR